MSWKAPVGPVVVMGVAGCGKSTVAEALADALGGDWFDADVFHPQANKDKMAAGVPLDDVDRAGWLSTLAGLLKDRVVIKTDRPVILACSALKKAYRQVLRVSPEVRFVYLKVDPALATARVAERPGHFMKAGMVDSQFQALEEPTGEADVVTVDARLAVDQVVRQAVEVLLNEERKQERKHEWKNKIEDKEFT
jgi:gluconokinase